MPPLFRRFQRKNVEEVGRSGKGIAGNLVCVIDNHILLVGQRNIQRRSNIEVKQVGIGIPDLLLIPSRPRLIDLEPAVQLIRQEIAGRLPYLIVFTMVKTAQMHLAEQRANELRGLDLLVSSHMIRDYSVYDEAQERRSPVHRIGGERHRTARDAANDFEGLTSEVRTLTQ